MRTPPLAHQQEELVRSAELPSRALFWEQGTGKTWMALATAAWLARKRLIDGVLVLAPNGVHENWASDEIPRHWDPEQGYRLHCYKTSKAGSKAHREALADVTGSPQLAFLIMSYDGFMTAAGKAAAKEFLARRRCLYVLDESARIKNPSAKRTKVVVASAKHAPYRRILTGTPVANSPFDVYSQVKFLDEEFWKARGFASAEAFRTHFGIWEQAVNGATGQRFNRCVAYRNLNQLHDIVTAVASRVTKEQVLDLPPKVYTKRYFDLSPAQAKVYGELRKDFVAFLDSGEMVTAPLVVVRLLRLQQVTCGYLPADDCESVTDFPENPRLKLLLETLEDCEGKAIVWARFRRDVDKICSALYPHAVRYDGSVGDEDRLAARRRFQDGDAKYFVANPAAAGEGLTLTAARSVIYYSNSFNLTHRLQSEDRAHRIGQGESVRYVDLVASGTVDNHLVAALRRKHNVAAQVTGDEVRQWL
mgnify:CR=1 FL=1